MKYKIIIHNLTKYQAETLQEGIKLDKRKYPVTFELED